MLNRETVLSKIKDAYETRMGENREALAGLWAPNARFCFAADMTDMPVSDMDHDDPNIAVGKIIDNFRLSELHCRDAVVEGHKAAVHWDVTVHVGEKGPLRTQLMDLIELDDEGRISSFVQFADTAAMRTLLSD